MSKDKNIKLNNNGYNEKNTLIQLCVPSINLCTEENLYARCNDLARYSYTLESFELSTDGYVYFDTYFNSFSVGRWKEYCQIDNLSVAIRCVGGFVVAVKHRSLEAGERLIKEVEINFDEVNELVIDIDDWALITDGMLFVAVRAITRGRILDLAFETSQRPVREYLKLGIVVTTFNRQAYVLPAIARLRAHLFSDERFKSLVSMRVIDNGSNLVCEDDENVIVLPNRNVGGAGGFTRGLIELQDDGSFTHCLFMDDDATCEIESVRRTIRILQYAREPDLTIAGAMLFEHQKFRQHECGALYSNGFVYPVKHGLDLRDPHLLLINENPQRIDYAAWWFYAFPLQMVTHYAFPFFVRGDDYTFSIQHAPKIGTMNGIATWQDAFESKVGPQVEYLSARSLLVSTLIIDGATSCRRISRHFFRLIMRHGYVYHYDRARAVIEAFEDVLKGPNFWKDNVDMVEKRAIIKSFTKEEIPVEQPGATGVRLSPAPLRTGKVRSFVTRLSLNGHLLPSFLMSRSGMVRVDLPHGLVSDLFYRRPVVLCYDRGSRKGYHVARDRKRFLSLVVRGFVLFLKMRFKFKTLRASYLAAYPNLTSRSFWDGWLASPKPTKETF